MLSLLNKVNFICICVFAFFFMPVDFSYAQYPSLKEVKNYYISTFPSGIYLKGILQEGISTGINQVGDELTLIMPSDISLNEIICIPKGSILV